MHGLEPWAIPHTGPGELKPARHLWMSRVVVFCGFFLSMKIRSEIRFYRLAWYYANSSLRLLVGG